jgi:hypothetical protein
MTRLTSMRRIALATAAACVVLSGCGPASTVDPIPAPGTATDTATPAADTTGTPTPEPSPETEVRFLVSLQRNGGMCAEGPCDWGIKVRTDGTYRTWSMNEEVRGQLTSADLATLNNALAITDLEDNRKPEQMCNAWTDGMDVTVTVELTAGERRAVSSCDYDFAGDMAIIELDRIREEATSGLESAD